MTIKRKTHLNLSGSHHTLDSDNAFIGGTVYVTGSVTASVGVSSSLIQGTNALFANISGSIASTSDGNPFVIGGSDIVVNYNSLGQWEISGSEAGFFTSPSSGVIRTTGSLEATYLSASTGAQITGSLQVLGGITGSISGTTGGLPFIVAGPNITASYNDSTGQWAITGSSATTQAAAGSDKQVQFNQNGAFAASSSFTFLSGTLTIPTISGSNLDNNFTGLIHDTAVALQSYLATEAIFSSSVPNIQLTGSSLVITSSHLLVSNSFIIADGTYVSAALSAAVGGGDYEIQASAINQILNGDLGGLGGFVAQNGAGYSFFEGNWGFPNLGGPSSLFSVGSTGQSGRAFLQLVGQLDVLSSSAQAGGQPPFQVGPYYEASNEVKVFVSGGLDIQGEAVRFTVKSGSNNSQAAFSIYGSSTPNQVDAALSGNFTLSGEQATFNFYSGSQVDSNPSFIIKPSDTVNQVNVIFDRNNNTGFDGINVRPLYVTMSTVGAAGTVLSGNLLTNALTYQTVGKLDFNVIAASAADDYASFTFSATVRRDSLGATSVISYTELDSALEGAAATAPWDVNINSDGVIYCTGSAGTVHWYAQVTKKMVLSGSGMIRY